MLKLILILASLTSIAIASSPRNAIGCFDPTGSESCIHHTHPDDPKNLATWTSQPAHELTCLAKHCWNEVYGCQYQEYAIQYLMPNNSYQVLYFPTSANVITVACFCNIRHIYLSLRKIFDHAATCRRSVPDEYPDHDPMHEYSEEIKKGCTCCEISGALSVLETICPDTNPQLIGIPIIERIKNRHKSDLQECGQWASFWRCEQTCGFSNKTASGDFMGLKWFNATSNGTLMEEGLSLHWKGELTDDRGTLTSPPLGGIVTIAYSSHGVVFPFTIMAVTATVRSASQTTAVAENAGNEKAKESRVSINFIPMATKFTLGAAINYTSSVVLKLSFSAALFATF